VAAAGRHARTRYRACRDGDPRRWKRTTGRSRTGQTLKPIPGQDTGPTALREQGRAGPRSGGLQRDSISRDAIKLAVERGDDHGHRIQCIAKAAIEAMARLRLFWRTEYRRPTMARSAASPGSLKSTSNVIPLRRANARRNTLRKIAAGGSCTGGQRRGSDHARCLWPNLRIGRHPRRSLLERLSRPQVSPLGQRPGQQPGSAVVPLTRPRLIHSNLSASVT